MPCYVHACEGPGRAEHCPLALGAAFWAAPVQARMIASGITAGPVPSPGKQPRPYTHVTTESAFPQCEGSSSFRWGWGRQPISAFFLAGTLCRSQTEYRSLMGSRNLLTTGVDMSRDLLSELATELSSAARPATKDAHSQSQTHHPTNHLPPLPLSPNHIIHSAACRYTATMWEA